MGQIRAPLFFLFYDILHRRHSIRFFPSIFHRFLVCRIQYIKKFERAFFSRSHAPYDPVICLCGSCFCSSVTGVIGIIILLRRLRHTLNFSVCIKLQAKSSALYPSRAITGTFFCFISFICLARTDILSLFSEAEIRRNCQAGITPGPVHYTPAYGYGIFSLPHDCFFFNLHSVYMKPPHRSVFKRKFGQVTVSLLPAAVRIFLCGKNV